MATAVDNAPAVETKAAVGAATVTAAPTAGERPRWRRRMRAAVIALTVVAGLVALDVAVVYGRIQRVEVVMPPDLPGTTYLLLGDDARLGLDTERFGSTAEVPGHRADVAIVVHVPERGEPTMLALPRDLMVFTEGGVPRRLNVTLLPGPQGTVDALCRSLGIAVDHVAILTLAGFTSLVDALGGVEVDVAAPTRDAVTGLDLEAAGRQRLGGDQLVAYVRSRRSETFDGTAWQPVAAGSETRPTQARQAMAGLAGAVDPRRPDRLQRAAWAAASATTLDAGTGLADLLRLARALGPAGQHSTDLPATTIEAQVPVAMLDDGAGDALAAVGVDPPVASRRQPSGTDATGKPGQAKACTPGLLTATRPASS